MVDPCVKAQQLECEHNDMNFMNPTKHNGSQITEVFADLTP